jgi:osmotically-inducible protein OsmY
MKTSTAPLKRDSNQTESRGMSHDQQLQAMVEQTLFLDSRLHAEHIGVSSRSGVVELDGTVNSYFEKYTAGQVTLRVGGVTSVANEIKVAILVPDNRSDSDIARIAVSHLQWNYSVPDTVKVSVTDGWVKFEGTVEAKYQKDEAEAVLRSLKGIKGIVNEIVIKPSVDVAVVKADIVDAFKCSAAIDANSINIKVANGTVTLTGHVHSWPEREEACRVAWASRGVTHVEDLLAIS